MNEWMNEWMNDGINEWRKEWMKEWMNEKGTNRLLTFYALGPTVLTTTVDDKIPRD